MPATLTNPARVPFLPDHFYLAMKGVIGRDSDHKLILGHGFCQFVYKPSDSNEFRHFELKVHELRKLLDAFDVTFSGTFCEFDSTRDRNWRNCLLIEIRYPVSKEKQAD